MAEDDLRRGRWLGWLRTWVAAPLLALARWIVRQVCGLLRRRLAKEEIQPTPMAAFIFVACPYCLWIYGQSADKLGLPPGSKLTLFAFITAAASAWLWMDAAWNSADRASNWAAAVYSAAAAFFSAGAMSFRPELQQLATVWQGWNLFIGRVLVAGLFVLGLVRLARWRS